jgi:tRNA(Ile)-lysidine synthetase-like protein
MSLSPYTFKFFRHVEKFCQSYDLLPPSGKLFIAASTGVDSMVLVEFGKYLLNQKLIKELEILHVNHGLRSESSSEENFLKKFCQKNNLTLHVKRLSKVPDSNFEAWARDERYRFFYSFLKTGDRLATAHHLEDAFEWHLLQQFKSSTHSSLGIPLQRGRIIRPFLSVSKKQIESLAKKNRYTFFQDQTNFDIKYERNFVRLEIIPKLQVRFPKYLKHYVQRSLELLKKESFKKASHRLFHHPDYGLHICFEIYPSIDEIISWIKKISNDKRGSLHKEVSKLLKAIDNGGTGPMDFSGGVKIYFNRSELLILNRVQLDFYAKLDQKILTLLVRQPIFFQKMSIKEFLKLNHPFPRFVISDDPWLLNEIPSSKSIHPLFPLTTSHLLQNRQWFCSANQLNKLCKKNPKYFDQVISIINLHQALETA